MFVCPSVGSFWQCGLVLFWLLWFYYSSFACQVGWNNISDGIFSKNWAITGQRFLLHYCNKTTLFRKLGIWIFIWSWYWKFPQLLQDIFKFLQFSELSWEDISYLVTLGNISDMVLLFNSRTFYHKTSLTKENNTAERCSLNILTVKHARKHFFKLDYMIAFCIITKKNKKRVSDNDQYACLANRTYQRYGANMKRMLNCENNFYPSVQTIYRREILSAEPTASFRPSSSPFEPHFQEKPPRRNLLTWDLENCHSSSTAQGFRRISGNRVLAKYGSNLGMPSWR